MKTSTVEEAAFVGTVVKAEVASSMYDPDIYEITLTYANGRVLTLTPYGAWGQEAWIHATAETADKEKA